MSGSLGVAKVIVSSDRLTAWMWVNVRAEISQVTRPRIAEAVEASRIVRTEAVNARVEELCALLESGTFPDGDFLLVQCPPPGESVDARFELDPSLKPQSADEAGKRVSHYDRNTVISVRMGQIIGRIIPAQPGKPGVDVYGNPVGSRRPANIILKSYVDLDMDGQTVVTSSDGQLVLEDNCLSIVPVLEIPGDVDFGTGNIDSAGSVVVHGSVKDLFRVNVVKDLIVDGHVEAAALQVGGDITIHGGVHGHGKAIIKAGGSVETRLCDGAAIEVGNNFTIQKECISSSVRADRKVLCPAGSIIGGQVWARNGVEAENLGSPAHVSTCVSAGVPLNVIEEMSQLQVESRKRQESAGKIRESIAPLLREMKRLTPQHRERATELMFQADQFDLEVKQMLQKRDDLFRQASPEGDPYVLVSGRLHAGVTIIISGRTTVIAQDVRGPLRILERKIDGVTTLVMVDQISGSVRALQTGKLSSDAGPRAGELAGSPA